MARTLDRTRDFAENHGDGAGEARYHQDNLWFDADGKELPGQTKRKQGPAAQGDGKTEGSGAGAGTNDQVNTQLNG